MRRLIFLFFVQLTTFVNCFTQTNSNGLFICEEQYGTGFNLPTNNLLKTGINADGQVYFRWYDSKTKNVLSEKLCSNPHVEIEHLTQFSEKEEREALMEIFNALGGENWTNKTNWGTDKPLSEWYGIRVYPNGTGEWTVTWLDLSNNNLVGELPGAAFAKLKNLNSLFLNSNQISGDLPECLKKLRSFNFCENKGSINGPLPEHPWSDIMNYVFYADPYSLRFWHLTDDWKVPEWAEKHPRFRDFWPNFLGLPHDGTNKEYLDYWSNKKIPMTNYRVVDLDGNLHTNAELYQNKLTLIYYWESWCPFSKDFNKKLIPAYNQLHDKGLDILGMSWLCSSLAVPCVDDETYLKYLEDANIPWKNCSVNWSGGNTSNNIVALIGFTSTPSIFAVDAHGNIVFQSITQNYSDVIPFIEEYFGEKIEGTAYYTSSDYSKDGEVFTMQNADKESGIDLVFMGDGFVDKDMAVGGKYERKMNAAMEQFFAVEPYKSLRDHFNVKGVKVVSPNAEFFSDAKRAICKHDDAAFRYAKKALGDAADKAMVVVVYNVDASVDRSYTTMYEDGSFVAYCMDGVSTILNHEAGGHGFAHLADEYIESGNENLTLPTERKDELDKAHAKDWYMNVDYNQGSQSTWKDYLNDSRYTSENIGSYEGAFLYGKGCYRPTENSMMRYNDTPFNAPSREAIYKRVMTLSDPSYKYSHEDFVEFDLATSKSASQAKGQGRETESLGNINYMVKASIENPNRFSPKRFLPKSPVLKKGSWKDNL